MAIDKVCGDNNNNDSAKNNDENEKKNIAYKTRAFAVSSWNAASKFTKDNQLIERGVEGTGKGIDLVGETISKLRGNKTKKNNNQKSSKDLKPNYEQNNNIVNEKVSLKGQWSINQSCECNGRM